MNILIKEQQESYEMQISVIFFKKKTWKKYLNGKKICKVTDCCHYTWEYRGTAHGVWNLKYTAPKKITNYGSNYDYLFIIKQLPEEFKKQFTCLGENSKKYITFSGPVEKLVIRIDANGAEITKNITYTLQCLIVQDW